MEQIKRFGHRDATYVCDFAQAQQVLKERVQEGDLLLTLGAGDVWKIGEEFLSK